jgi:isoleucyl-tRNA synthetase
MERDLKDTLNLPKTGFPMKASLPQKEPETLAFWQSVDVYRKVQEKNAGGRAYILHDGPPYANGRIHIGHALNKILKDIIVKYKSMKGHSAPYVPGWDCHGLPIELEVDKKLGKKKHEMDVLEKRRLCREYAEKFLDIQREEFKRLGVFGDWENPYLTMSYDYEATIVGELFEFVRRGSLYRGKKPVHWCPSCVTALAEAEVEYADKESPSVFVKFELSEKDATNRLKLEAGKKYFILIWTTTPWTLPANLALAVRGNINYAAVLDKEQKEFVIVADDLVKRLHEQGILPTNNVYRIFPGNDLKGLQAKHPFIDRKSKIIEADFVSTEEGSGVVHIAPGHGEDDYAAGLKEGLEVFAPVDDRGRFEGTGVEELEGEFVFKANERIIDMLKERGALLHRENISHSYPHCWRCKKPVIFRATEQWFISMKTNGLREKCLEEINRVRWIPAWGKERIYGMLQRRPDWCISRQRAWGVPITVLTCPGCGEIVADEAFFERTAGLVREHGADVWFTKEAGEFLPGGYKCRKCGGASFKKEMDILDVWFDSGVSHAAVLTPERGLGWPADLYLEGSDQHRGWFQSSLLESVGTRGKAPYGAVLTHGFTVDGQGKKMSKSLGNVVAPQDVIKQTGAEILRLWVSAEDYRGDVRISGEIVARLTEAYRKIRNTARFLLGNLYDYDGSPGEPMEIDRWALSRLHGLTRKVTQAYESFDFHEVYHRLYNFCIVDMSSFYLDILKDRLYTFRADSPERRAAQRVLSDVLTTMTRLMAPVLSFTAEEIWQSLGEKPAESVFLADFPEADESLMDEELEKRWEKLIGIRDEVLKALEIKRAEKFIGNSLEAKVVLYAGGETTDLLDAYREFLPALFIVSQAELMPKGSSPAGREVYAPSEVSELWVLIEKAEGEKCQRCWNRSTSVGSFADAPEVCAKCYGHIK